jgi:hypothetical protein
MGFDNARLLVEVFLAVMTSGALFAALKIRSETRKMGAETKKASAEAGKAEAEAENIEVDSLDKAVALAVRLLDRVAALESDKSNERAAREQAQRDHENCLARAASLEEELAAARTA